MILETIADATRRRVEAQKRQVPQSELESAARALAGSAPRTFPFEAALAQSAMSFICEVKKASPSKGVIAEDFPYMDIARDYAKAGAGAISVLTEPEYFLGSPDYLREIRAVVDTPLLRKDFIVDAYQIYESKLLGADAVLLICALLDTATLRQMRELCDTLGLSALVEAHDEAEVCSALAAGARVIGVNNRNLKTFEVDFNNCIRLRPLVPETVLFVAESGIKTAEDIKLLQEAGVNAVLIGETLMRSGDKKAALDALRRLC